MPVRESTHQASILPEHVAIIMDGNGRWARARHLPRTAGHKKGLDTTTNIVEACVKKGVRALTLFAFSSENWRRPEEEVSSLMELFLIALNREINKLHKNGVRVRFIGDLTAFSEKLQESIHKAEALTADNSGLQLQVAVNYGGRWDITQAVRQLADSVANGDLAVDEISETQISSRLCTSDLPEPDLFIRTGGEHRISNFLMWQLAYTELFFTDVLWPDFSEDEFDQALDSFAGRQRRFGMTGEQVEQVQNV
ncbi:MAG: isoprenyl transferase [Gammaproteobacteria bacterium]|nr:isoprenyl transferase [Gammaproteobacteria bacterium]